MLKPVIMALGLACLLAGCYTPLPKRPDKPAADWQADSTRRPRPGTVAKTNHPPEQRAVVASPVPSVVTESPWLSLSRWATDHSLAAPRRVSTQPRELFAVVSSAGVFALQPNSTRASWNGAELRLGFKPKPGGATNDLLVHALDLTKNLLPLLRPPPAAREGGKVIVIDAGHGGSDRGTCAASGNCEETFTLDWALRLGRILETNGWTVRFTRTNDVDVPRSARVDFAERHRAALFVSLHFNHSGGGAEPAGVETYCLTPTGMESTLTRNFPDDPAEVLPNNAFDADNLRLAARVHQELIKLPGLLDRGIRRARFQTVLRGQQRPAILVEGGFLSNDAEARRIADPEFRQQLAEAVAKGIGS